MEVEVYRSIEAEILDEAFLTLLQKGWGEVASLLKGLGVGELAELPALEISLLDDAEMARIHGEFLADATPTDVITFDHGELLIGVETAARQADEFGSSQAREIALYGIHGMLHLAGYDDREAVTAKKMAERQFELLEAYFPSL